MVTSPGDEQERGKKGSQMRRRDATTLVEVLVAIFVMALGLLTLLTLFPLGALSMAQAIRDDRTAQAAANAAAIAESMGLRQDPGVNSAFWNTIHSAMPAADGASYPVYVDPVGKNLGVSRLGVLNGYSTGIIRQTPAFFDQDPTHYTKQTYRWFSLLDEMIYQKDGNAGTPNSPNVDRECRYSWAYMLRRPKFSVPSVVDIAVVVYNGRPFSLPLGEAVYGPMAFTTNTTNPNNPKIVRLNYTGEKPDIRRGSWILDATIYNPKANPPGPEPHGFFYRVVGVNDAGTYMELELQNTPRMGTCSNLADPNTYYGVLVVMENVVEVFEKGAGWMP
jgi:hypothetical protein